MDQILRLETECFPKAPYSRQLFEQIYSMEGTEIWVFERDEGSICDTARDYHEIPVEITAPEANKCSIDDTALSYDEKSMEKSILEGNGTPIGCRTLDRNGGPGDCQGTGKADRIVGDIAFEKGGHAITLAVARDQRRSGIGTALLKHALMRITGGFLYFEVRTGNKNAKKLYSGLDARCVGIRRGYYRDPPDDAEVWVIPKGKAHSRS